MVPKLKHFSDEGKLGLVIPRKWHENDVFSHSRVILGFGWPGNEMNDNKWLGWGQSHSGQKTSFLGHFLIPDSFWDEWDENEWNDVDIFPLRERAGNFFNSGHVMVIFQLCSYPRMYVQIFSTLSPMVPKLWTTVHLTAWCWLLGRQRETETLIKWRRVFYTPTLHTTCAPPSQVVTRVRV